jgi:hypothetical protein
MPFDGGEREWSDQPSDPPFGMAPWTAVVAGAMLLQLLVRVGMAAPAVIGVQLCRRMGFF